MSDLDKFFNKKLDEESPFPRREKNWRMLSKRLDAFDAGGQMTASKLRYWQAAAAISLLVTGWLTWKVISVKSEKTALQQEVVVLQEKNAAAEREVAFLKEKQLKEPSFALLEITAPQVKIIPPPQIFAEKGKASTSLNFSGSEQISDKSSDAHPVVENLNHSSPSVYKEKTPSDDSSSLTNSAQVEATGLAVFKNIQTPLLPPKDALENTTVASQRKVLSKALPLPQSDAIAADKIIEPVRESSRFRAGVQALVGTATPGEKGVSLLTGQGITAEYALGRNFSLTASADWLRYDVATDKFCSRFHSGHEPPKPPPPLPGGPPPKKLTKVEGTQRQQHYALGLRYILPVQFWVRPSLRLAHTWVHTSPEILSFKFQKPGPPHGGPPPFPPDYIVQKTEVQTLSNVWRLGIGLEHEISRWTFGVWADYSKDLAVNDQTFDALLFRAGVQYKFN